MELDTQSAGLPVAIAGVVAALVNYLIFRGKIRERERRGDAQVEVAKIEADDRANARLAESNRRVMAMMENRLTVLERELHDTRQELDETRETLAEKTEEWMIAARSHEDCTRELRSTRAQLFALQERVQKLEGK